MTAAFSFFRTRQKSLAIVATLYVVFLLLSHWQLPKAHVWNIAAFFSIAMNFTYLTEALSLKKSVTAEVIVSATLIGASLLGQLLSPLLIIAAIFAHGCWDLAKHNACAGIPFFSWYVVPCFVVDTIYSLTLLVYYFR